ncbi:putative acetyltransferase [Fulvivirga imtechensis AK7]|uniref:Putative acetyltransferase n=1 Tax=Fulvivirga imtechensis AK7 TaxID=1237149 RepID=L8JWU8_9BACT|nr:GNAT family N-acetyltransferase [Fulvivirga imtechensis]ELR71682.1 putative acetyltransferase [Fulvivirga imtechensis AK7]
MKGLSYVDSGLSCDTFNIIHISDGNHATNEALAGVLDYFKKHDLEYCIWVSESNKTAVLEAVFESYFITRQGEEVGMVLDLEKYQPFYRDEYENIRIVNSKEALFDYANVVASNWEPADQNVIKYYNITGSSYLDPANGIMLLVYYHDGKPVGTIEMFPSDSATIGLYGLATIRSFRGKGIGSALMDFALNKAKEKGYQQAVLQATEDGIGIYRKQGFVEYSKYYEYS